MKILDDLEISKAKDTLLIIFLLSIIKNIIFKNLSLLLFKSVIELLKENIILGVEKWMKKKGRQK